jgi:hypothetical protein
MGCLIFLGVGLVVFLLALLMGAALLRGAVFLANLCIGTEKPTEVYDEFEHYGDYRRPRRYADTGGSIPEPTLGQSMLIVFIIAFVNFIVGLIAGFAVSAAGVAANVDQQTMTIISQAMGLPISFLTGSFLLAGMLPTTFGKGCLVTFFQYVIGIGIAVAIVTVVYFAFGGFPGR